jgi:hypothetical protein
MTQTLQFSKRNSRKGSVLIMGTLTISVLFAFMGLALDVSYMYFHKRRMQTAADAGAIAGAQEILRGNANSAIVTSARNDSALDGFTNGSNGVTVTVNNPPLSGTNVGNSSYVEVIVSQAQPTWFMRIIEVSSATVSARAVAGIGSGDACVYALNPNTGNNSGFFINGTANANFACGIYSNSNFRAVGSGCVTAPHISYVGTNTNGTGCTPSVSSGVQVVDPLKNKYAIPAHAASCDSDHTDVKFTKDPTGSTTRTLSPGTYCGGIDIGGSSTNVVFSAGEYILLGGGLSVTSSVNVTGANVTFFNTFNSTYSYGDISITGSGLMTLTAPTTGTYKGLLFYQDPTVTWSSNNGSIIAGSATSVYEGILYFPSTDLDYTGNSSSSTGRGYTLLVGYNVTVRGNSTINADYSDIGGTSPIQIAQFSE